MQIQKPADLARVVKTRRQALQLTQHDVADSAGITRQSLARIERGHAGTSFDTVLRIFERLGISIEVAPSPRADVIGAAANRNSDTSPLTAAALATESSAIAEAAAAATQINDSTRSASTHDARRAALRAAIEGGDPDLNAPAAAAETPSKKNSKGKHDG